MLGCLPDCLLVPSALLAAVPPASLVVEAVGAVVAAAAPVLVAAAAASALLSTFAPRPRPSRSPKSAWLPPSACSAASLAACPPASLTQALRSFFLSLVSVSRRRTNGAVFFLLLPPVVVFPAPSAPPYIVHLVFVMSWQSYVDDQLMATKLVKHAVICGHDGNIWAQSSGFTVSYHLLTILQCKSSCILSWLRLDCSHRR